MVMAKKENIDQTSNLVQGLFELLGLLGCRLVGGCGLLLVHLERLQLVCDLQQQVMVSKCVKTNTNNFQIHLSEVGIELLDLGLGQCCSVLHLLQVPLAQHKLARGLVIAALKLSQISLETKRT